MRLIKPIVIVSAAVLTLGLAGCSANPVESLVEGVIENQTGIDVDTGTPGSSASLPEGWPDLPVPAGTITSAIAADQTYAITVVVDDEQEIERVIAELESAGFTEVTRADLGGIDAVVLETPEWTVSLSWLAIPDEGTFQLNYGASPTGG